MKEGETFEGMVG